MTTPPTDTTTPITPEEIEGVKAIVFLQSLGGVTESEEKALRGWRGMPEGSRESTLSTYRLLNPKPAPEAGKAKVKITTYKDNLVIETDDSFETAQFLPNGNGRIGCMLTDTATCLGMSEEAFAWLKARVQPSSDAIGDVMWHRYGGVSEKLMFGWLGGPNRIIRKDARPEGDRDWAVHEGAYLKIENVTSDEARKYIDDNGF